MSAPAPPKTEDEAWLVEFESGNAFVTVDYMLPPLDERGYQCVTGYKLAEGFLSGAGESRPGSPHG